MSAQVAVNPHDLSSVAYAEAATASTSRLALLDTTRLIAAIGIIWVHAATSTTGLAFYPVGTFGVPFYIFVALLFMTRSLTRNPDKPLYQYILSRFTRIYLPFVAWTAIYVLLSQAKTIMQSGQFEWPTWRVLYAGGHQHLWFLPFLMTVSICAAILVRLLASKTRLQKIVAAVFVVAGPIIAFTPEPAWIATREAHGDMEFFRFAFRALPSVCFAIALALATCMNGRLPRSNHVLAAGGFILFIAALLAQFHTGAINILRACAGLGILIFALWPVIAPALQRFGSLGRYSYGIYLSHIVFIRIVVLWTEKFNVPPSIWLDIATAVFALLASLGLSILLYKSKYTRWLTGD